MKHIEDDKIRIGWIDKFRYHDNDEDARINSNDSTFTLSSLNKTNYQIISFLYMLKKTTGDIS